MPAESEIAEHKEDHDDNADNGEDVHLVAPIDGKLSVPDVPVANSVDLDPRL
jgi:hypothetical protein